jgi:hypothetical protein
MKQFIFTSIALLCSAVIFGQVNDQYFENKDAFKTYPQLLPANKNMIVKAMPSFNVDSLLEDNKELEERGSYPGMHWKTESYSSNVLKQELNT